MSAGVSRLRWRAWCAGSLASNMASPPTIEMSSSGFLTSAGVMTVCRRAPSATAGRLGRTCSARRHRGHAENWSVDWAVVVLVAAAVPASVQQRKRQRQQVVVEAVAAAVAVAVNTVRIRGRCTSVSKNGSSSVVYLGSVWVAVGGWLWVGRGIAPVLPPPPLSPPSLPSMKSEPQPSRLHLRDRLREEMSPPLDGDTNSNSQCCEPLPFSPPLGIFMHARK